MIQKLRNHLLILLSPLCLSLAWGCQVPSYKLPGGYSSTYSRFLHGERIDAFADPPDEAEVGGDAASAVDSPGVFYPQTFRFDPPTKSEFRQAVQLPRNRPARRRRY